MSARCLCLFVLAVTAAACGDDPPGPGPTPNQPQLSCGPAIVMSDLVAGPQPVSYPAPMVTGGSPPVTVTCTPASESIFAIGETTVTCAGVDALGRQASCTLLVTLRARQLGITKFLAFGDSLTEGENGIKLALPTFVDTPNAYPTQLQAVFTERFPAQPIVVVNAGKGGERVTENDSRLKDQIARNAPDALLLLEGINDLNSGTVGARTVTDALRDNIRTAYSRGVKYVFVSTLLPPGESGRNRPSESLVQQTNALIRPMVPAAGAYLVDPYEVFLANRAAYIEADGLHLKPAGYSALATAFLERILGVIPAEQLSGRVTTH